jgi:molecular chaperone HtpG
MDSETYAFSADINQLLSLIINTFYSNKEVFIRELVSNASDALDKIRYQSLTDSKVLDNEQNLEIRISFDKENKRLIIQDTGIGMTKEDMVKNLGTIAKSGTKAFIESLSAGADVSMIGQFGVGFYSAYLVADKVSVISKHNDDGQYIWESTAGGSFTIGCDNSIELKRGTAIILHLKDDMHNYLEENEIRRLIKKHNQFIDFPIYLQTIKTREVEIQSAEAVENAKEDAKEETSDDVKVEDVDDDGDGENVKKPDEKKTVTETYNEWEFLNQEKPIWTRNPKDVTNEQYASFYKTISGDYSDHLDVSHFSVEGQLDIKGLLFVPKRAPYDLFDGQNKKASNIKLYVRRVFITDNCEDLVPDYLRFVKGVIDSEDLPLNISRETLQQNKIMKVIKKNIMKKCLDLFNNIAEDSEKYNTFYEQFSKSIKLGVHEDSVNRAKLSALLRYESSKSDGILTSFDDYIGRMKEGQKGIYYITGESKKSIINSPFLEQLKKRDIEVLFMFEPLDEYVTTQLKDYNNHKLICITKEKLELEEDDKESFESLKSSFEKVCVFMKEVLGEEVEKVVISNRLDSSPCVLVTSEYGMSANMQRIMKAQALGSRDNGYMMMNKKILEINPYNKMIMRIKDKLESDESGADSKMLKDLVHLIYDVTLQSSGFNLEDPSTFSKRIFKVINIGLGVNDDDNEDAENDYTNDIVVNESSNDTQMEEVD